MHALAAIVLAAVAASEPRTGARSVGEERDDWYGHAVALERDVAFVAASAPFSGPGRVDVFGRSDDSWAHVASLRSGAERVDMFGWSLAASGELVLVGAPRLLEGRAYLFRRDGEQWTLVQELTAPDGRLGDDFGWSVALEGTRAVVGAWQHEGGARNTGAAYVYELANARLEPRAKLEARLPAAGDRFGAAVAVHGDRVAVGATNADASGVDSGAVHVFRRDPASGAWHEEAMLAPAGTSHFGNALAMDERSIVVGAPRTRRGPLDAAEDARGAPLGRAFVFDLERGRWAETELLPTCSVREVGRAVAVRDSLLAVGAPSGANGGVVALFHAQAPGTWIAADGIRPAPAQARDGLGTSVALREGLLLVGVSRGDVAYLLERAGGTWVTHELRAPAPAQ